MGARIYRQASTWAQRRGGHGYMGISLHSRAHTGAGLWYMLDWVNRESAFDRLRIGLSDTLNRFNYMGDEALTEEQARAKALSIGDQWLVKNAPSLSCLTIPYEIIRWDHWQTTNPDVIAKNRRTYMNAFRANPAFREAMLQDMDNFMRRRYKKTLSETDFYATGPLVNYLIEELAVYEEIYRDYPNTTIYPGKQLNVVTVLRSGALGLSETFPDTRFERLYLPMDDNSAVVAKAA